MLQGSELALDRVQIERSRNRKAAVMAKGGMAGYKFIRLQLKNIRKRKISGIDVLSAIDFVNEEMGGITDYHLELRGGDIDFEYRPEFGAFLFDMVDTDRNRNFLASHYEFNFWEIQDEAVKEDVYNRYRKIKLELLRKTKVNPDGDPAFWEEVRKSEAQAKRAFMENGPAVPVEEKTEKAEMPEVGVASNVPDPGVVLTSDQVKKSHMKDLTEKDIAVLDVQKKKIEEKAPAATRVGKIDKPILATGKIIPEESIGIPRQAGAGVRQP